MIRLSFAYIHNPAILAELPQQCGHRVNAIARSRQPVKAQTVKLFEVLFVSNDAGIKRHDPIVKRLLYRIAYSTQLVLSLSVVSDGNIPAGLLCEGDLVLSSTSTLNIELGGVTPSVQYDQVRVDGELSLSGRLNVTLINSFTPSAGNSFQIIEWGTLAGEFSQIDLPTLPETLEWDLSKLYVNGAIIAVPVDECRADIAPDGGDGVVNVNDLLAVINAWGACPQPCDADTCDADIAPIGGDCMVNVNDLLELINAWGPCLK